MKFATRRLSALRVYQNNPRDNSDAISRVKASIERYGYKVPIVVDDQNVIVAGHTRFAALLQINEATGQYAEISVVLADDLDDNQLKQFRIVDNQVANLSKWDFTKLNLELGTIEDFILDDFGIIPGFAEDIVFDEPESELEAEGGIKFAFGSDKFTLTEAEYHQWAAWVIRHTGLSVLDYVKSQLHIDPATRTYDTDEPL